MKSSFLSVWLLSLSMISLFAVSARTQTTGSLKVTVTDNGGVLDTIRFGEAHGATSGQDVGLGEYELPPVPPSGAFDVRWIVSGVEGLSIDYRDTLNAQNKKNTWTLQFQPSSAGYPVTITWDSTKLWSGFFQMYDAATGGTKLALDMAAHGKVTVTDNTIKSLIVIHTFTVDRSVNMQAGWNLVSVPVNVKDWNTTDIFPGSISAYSYEGGYQAASVMVHGLGYWVNYSGSAILTMTGEPLAADTFVVASGWNLIGSPFSSVPTASIQQIPNSIITSYFFSFSNGYKQATSILPGQGIWVKSSQAGKLVLSSSSLSKVSPDGQLVDTSKWNTITVFDGTGASAELLFTRAAEDLSRYDLPPKPPGNVFDARFDNDKFAGILQDSASALQIELQPGQTPISLGWDIKNGVTYVLSDLSQTPILLKSSGSLQVDSPSNSGKIRLAVSGNLLSLPTRFVLHQSYPNPFNPSAKIAYEIPEVSYVSLAVYDILGRQVAELVNGVIPPGRYEVVFDGSKLASGIYISRITAGNFVQTRKMLLAK